MNIHPNFDRACRRENERRLKEAQKQERAKEAKHKLEKAAPDLLAACQDTRGIIDAGYAMKCISAPKNYHVQLDLALKQLTAAIDKATT